MMEVQRATSPHRLMELPSHFAPSVNAMELLEVDLSELRGFLDKLTACGERWGELETEEAHANKENALV